MIAAIKMDRFYLETKLKTEFGVPGYITSSKSEDELKRMSILLPENPWAFYDKDSGFSIRLCDRIAEKLKINNSFERCKAFLQYAIDYTADHGHCYAKEWQINNILNNEKFSQKDIDLSINYLQKDNVLFVSQKGNYFLSKYFSAEKRISELLLNLARRNGHRTGFKKYKSDFYYLLNDNQKAVVDAIEKNRLIVLTGLPGTGKTTTIRTIVDSYGYDNVVLLAPTGKAASRMSELCDMEASTLHSFFFSPMGGAKTVENKIVIIDETSMCDVEIGGLAAEGICDNCVLILVGDPDQLPSVGPGQVLQDVLDSKVGARYHLDKIMRQQPGSIIKSAHAIHNGKTIVQDDDNEVSVYIPNEWNVENITKKVMSHPKWKTAQFLSVLKDKGSVPINKSVQSILIPNTSYDFNIGDKVIHTKNNKELGVYNGEMGVVKNRGANALIVEFKDKEIVYPSMYLWQLELAYCITVHKSQGSEFDDVILVLNKSRITTRNLLYTAITRAKKHVLIIAPDYDVINESISNKQTMRQTSLKWLIQKGSYGTR